MSSYTLGKVLRNIGEKCAHDQGALKPMSIVFLIAYEESPHSGVVRPFINWAKALKDRATIALYRCSSHLESYTYDIANVTGFKVMADENFHRLVTKLRDEVDYLISDDYVPRLKLLLEARDEIGVKCATYVQVLYGIHSIARNFNKNHLSIKTRILFSMSSALPFKLISHGYRSTLGKMNKVIANSGFTTLMLSLLYGIEPAGIVHPPIDTDVFRPLGVKTKDKEVLVYLGSNAGDTCPTLLKQLLELLISSNCIDKINLFGNKSIYQSLSKFLSHSLINTVPSVSDMELAQMYSKSIFTISPQEWETFGYVPVESMLCGTPVLAFALMPFTELLQDKDIAHLVYSRKALLERVEELLTDMDCLQLMKQSCLHRREDLLNIVSQAHSADRLLSVLS